jgi:hypothetical protein
MLGHARIVAFAILATGLGLMTFRPAAATQAEPASLAAMGCANGQSPTAISFPTTPAANGAPELSGTTQVPEPGVPAVLSRSNHALAWAACGPVFEDSDGTPTVIDGGTIHFHVGPGLIILESNSQDFTIPCGAWSFESCQGGVNHMDLQYPFGDIFAMRVSPSPANIVHIAPDPSMPTASQGWIQATWTGYWLNPLLPPQTITTNVLTVRITN